VFYRGKIRKEKHHILVYFLKKLTIGRKEKWGHVGQE